MFRRILVTVWAFIVGGVALLGLFPKLATRVPRPRFLFAFLFTFILISLVYSVLRVYRHGIKRAKIRAGGEENR